MGRMSGLKVDLPYISTSPNHRKGTLTLARVSLYQPESSAVLIL